MVFAKVYSVDSVMEMLTRRAGKRGKTRQPFRGREGARRLNRPEQPPAMPPTPHSYSATSSVRPRGADLPRRLARSKSDECGGTAAAEAKPRRAGPRLPALDPPLNRFRHRDLTLKGFTSCLAGVRRGQVHLPSPMSPRNCAVPAPFLPRFRDLLFTTPCSPTTCKTGLEKWCNSPLTSPLKVASASRRCSVPYAVPTASSPTPANVAAELDRFWTVSGPISISLFINHCPPATCKTNSQSWSNSWLTLPSLVLAPRQIAAIPSFDRRRRGVAKPVGGAGRSALGSVFRNPVGAF
jgi:hypothetical protein